MKIYKHGGIGKRRRKRDYNMQLAKGNHSYLVNLI